MPVEFTYALVMQPLRDDILVKMITMWAHKGHRDIPIREVWEIYAPRHRAEVNMPERLIRVLVEEHHVWRTEMLESEPDELATLEKEVYREARRRGYLLHGTDHLDETIPQRLSLPES